MNTPRISTPSQSVLEKGFTLIELLVVIAVIGILSGILIQVAGKARASANKVTCTTNLRNAHNWLMLYAQDHKNRFPAPNGLNLDRPSDTQTYSWWMVLQGAFHTNAVTPAVGETNPELNPWFCPAAGEGFPNGVRRVYAINADGATATQYYSPKLSSQWAQTLLIADAPSNQGSADSYAYFRRTGTSPGPVLDPRHNGNINGIFLDGHIASFVSSEPMLETWIKNLRQ